MPTASAQTLTRQYCYGTIFLFGLVTVGALIGLPTYAYFFDYTWVDWAMFGLLYVMTGLGITVGYHRLLAHRSFDCPNWVKGDRKSTRLNSSHSQISYAVFCLK